MQTLVVRYYAGAAAASGIEQETIEVPRGADITWLRAELQQRHPDLTTPLPACSLLVDGSAVTDDSQCLDGVISLDVLPPFAGG